MSKVTTKPIRLKLSERGQIEKCRAAAIIIREMNEGGISASGAPFPKGKTVDKITMNESGSLHRDFEAYTTRLQYKAPYAARWQKEFNWLGIPVSGIWRERFEKLVQQLIKKELTSEG